MNARQASRIALLGTGKMGSAIARRLDEAGYGLTVWNRTRARAEALGLGRIAASPADAVRDADVVISSLTGPDALNATYFGAKGAISGATGQLFIDMSTAGPTAEIELGSAVRAAGASFVEAPILGSPVVVAAGQAVVLVGGDGSDLQQAIPVLEAIGQTRSVGPLGSAARLKLVANSMLADVMEAAAELQAAGQAAGLDTDDVFWVLQRLVPSLEGRRAGLLGDDHAPTQFALRDLGKDVDLALALFRGSGARTPLTRSASQLVGAAASQTPDLDIAALSLPYRSGLDEAATRSRASVASPGEGM